MSHHHHRHGHGHHHGHRHGHGHQHVGGVVRRAAGAAAFAEGVAERREHRAARKEERAAVRSLAHGNVVGAMLHQAAADRHEHQAERHHHNKIVDRSVAVGGGLGIMAGGGAGLGRRGITRLAGAAAVQEGRAERWEHREAHREEVRAARALAHGNVAGAVRHEAAARRHENRAQVHHDRKVVDRAIARGGMKGGAVLVGGGSGRRITGGVGVGPVCANAFAKGVAVGASVACVPPTAVLVPPPVAAPVPSAPAFVLLVTITGYRTNPGGFTEYEITTSLRDGTLVKIMQRYSSFEALHTSLWRPLQLRRNWRRASGTQKTYWFKNTVAVKEQRKTRLTLYLRKCVGICSASAFFPPELCAFLCVAPHQLLM